MHDAGAQSRRSVTTWKDGVGSEGEGGSEGGDTCVPMADACRCMAVRVCAHAKPLQSCPPLCNPMDGSPPGSSVLGFSRQEYWGGGLCSPPGDLPDPGSNLHLLSLALAGGFSTTSTTWEGTRREAEAVTMSQLSSN